MPVLHVGCYVYYCFLYWLEQLYLDVLEPFIFGCNTVARPFLSTGTHMDLHRLGNDVL